MSNIITIKNTPVAGRRPAGARQGELYFNFADRVIGCVDSTGKPVDIASAIAVSDTAPANPVPGQLWLNTLLTPDTLQVFMGAAATPPWASVTASVVIATEAEAIAGTDNTKMMTPLRVKQASSGAGSAVAIGDTAPTSPKAGQLWYRTLAPVGLFVWLIDVDSSQWVQTSAGATATAASAASSALEASVTLLTREVEAMRLVDAEKEGLIRNLNLKVAAQAAHAEQTDAALEELLARMAVQESKG